MGGHCAGAFSVFFYDPGETMIYLASPYTHCDHAVRLERYRAVCRAAAGLIRRGRVVFSPIAHSHAITEHGLPRSGLSGGARIGSTCAGVTSWWC